MRARAHGLWTLAACMLLLAGPQGLGALHRALDGLHHGSHACDHAHAGSHGSDRQDPAQSPTPCQDATSCATCQWLLAMAVVPTPDLSAPVCLERVRTVCESAPASPVQPLPPRVAAARPPPRA
ncbi:MAG: hypothetical protein ACO32J_00860 [Phycisphaerales bacterium]